jgi:hypothetical protein
MKQLKTGLLALMVTLSFGWASAATYHEAKVKEVVHAGSYTYLNVQSGERDYWAVVQRADMPEGAWVRFKEEMAFPTYESKALERTFEDVVFASELYYRTTEEASKHLDLITEPVDASPYKQADTLSIQELQKKHVELAGKEIVLRAKVVKVSQHILDRNWVHLQDGTGSAYPGEAVGRVVATSQEAPTVGDVVRVKARVAIDKDFGSGYVYPIILEEATFGQ